MLEDFDMGEGILEFIWREFGGVMCDDKFLILLLKCICFSCDMYV